MSRDQFSIDVPMPHLTLATNGHGSNGSHNSPNPVKSPNTRRVAHFSREGILGSAQKARNLSQSSGERESMTNGLQNGNVQNSDDGINPLKRRSTDAAIDYPRRRATIAVRISFALCELALLLTWPDSVRSAARGNPAVMEPSQSASSAPNWAQSASIESLASSSTQEISSYWNASLGLRGCSSRA